MSASTPDIPTKRVKLALSDFGTNFDPDKCPWVVILRRHFDIRLCGFDEADYLLYSGFGFNHAKFDGVKIFCTEENRAPDWNACDYAFTHELIESPRHLRVPCYVPGALVNPEVMDQFVNRPEITLEDLAKLPRKFCNFVYRNPVCKVRNRFFKKLSQYKPVDSAGPLYNNVGYCVEDKVEFQRGYKFTIAFENEAHPGYQTEKLTDALRSRTLPIYWGNIKASEEFDSRSYLDYSQFANEEELIKRIIEIDQDDNLLLEYLNAPILMDRSRTCLDEERLVNRFREIFDNPAVQRSSFDRFKYNVSQICGRGFFRQLNRFGRYLRGKK